MIFEEGQLILANFERILELTVTLAGFKQLVETKLSYKYKYAHAYVRMRFSFLFYNESNGTLKAR